MSNLRSLRKISKASCSTLSSKRWNTLSLTKLAMEDRVKCTVLTTRIWKNMQWNRQTDSPMKPKKRKESMSAKCWLICATIRTLLISLPLVIIIRDSTKCWSFCLRILVLISMIERKRGVIKRLIHSMDYKLFHQI